jgi:hypothetical protein
MSETRRRQHGPTPAAATDIGADAFRRQKVPWKDRKIAFEHRAAIFGGQRGLRLREGRPLAADSFDRCPIGIFLEAMSSQILVAARARACSLTC